jgi:hypothetical protein
LGPFDQDFLADCPYEPDALMFDELITCDHETSTVVCRWPTHDDLPITRLQRVHPERHPRHVSGGLMVHATGMLGFVHAYHVLGLRHHEGWVGYGTHIHRVVFRKLVVPGTPIIGRCTATRVRKGRSRYFVRYELEFRHEDELCYEGEQSAMWTRVGPDAEQPSGGLL